MRIIDPGHRYALANLKSNSETVLQFYQDPELHGGEGAAGPSCQEVIRALIDRVQTLHAEKPHHGNERIIRHLRLALAEFEARALVLKAEKGFEIEQVDTGDDGHLRLSMEDHND